MQIQTTRGVIDLARLERIVGVEDRPREMVLWVEFRIAGDESRELVRRDTFRIGKALGDTVTTTLGQTPRAQLQRLVEVEDNDAELVVAEVFKVGGEIVHRSVHVVKKVGVEAAAVAAAIGG